MAGRLLLVVDDARAAEPLTEHLLRARLQADVCLGLRSALEKLRLRQYEAVVVDLPLSAADAVRLSQELRSRTDTPLVFLCDDRTASRPGVLARSGIGYPPYHDGIDVPPPGSQARPAATAIRFGRFSVDLGAMRATYNDVPLDLTPTEFKLLAALADRPGQVLSREELLLRVWSYTDGGDGGRLVDVHVGRLRKKMRSAGIRDVEVETARGFGYRLATNLLSEVG
jgi:two-component system response regulator MtrA